MNGGGAVPAEGVDRQALRAALGAALESMEEAIALLLEVAAEVAQAGGVSAATDGEEPRRVLAAISGRLAAARDRMREARDRLEAWIDRLRDADDPAAEDLEQVQAALGSILLDRLEPARAALRELLDEVLPGAAA